jgi:hypothetical protein
VLSQGGHQWRVAARRSRALTVALGKIAVGGECDGMLPRHCRLVPENKPAPTSGAAGTHGAHRPDLPDATKQPRRPPKASIRHPQVSASRSENQFHAFAYPSIGLPPFGTVR